MQQFLASLTLDQQKAFKGIIKIIEDRKYDILKKHLSEYQISLQGPAGTGKTFLVTALAKYMQTKSYDFVITAPTHQAVGVLSEIFTHNNMEVTTRTIHSFLGIKMFRDYNTGEEKFRVDKTKKVENESTDILFVDESSMISVELYKLIIETIQKNLVKIVVFIGDAYQLLSVKRGHNSIFSLKNQFYLDEIVRQAKDSYIIKLATKIRERIKHKNFIDLKEFVFQNQYKEIEFFHNQNDFIDSFCKNKEWFEENKILATYRNYDVDGFNRIIRRRFWNEKGNKNPPTLLAGDMLRFKEPYTIGDVTLYHNSEIIKLKEANKKYNEELGIYYWECRDMNNLKQQIFRVVEPKDMSIFNDKLSYIANLAKREKHNKERRQEFWKIFFQLKEMYANVQYIYSSTIHKLQGSTYKECYIDLFSLAKNTFISNEDKYRLFYVAVTRASENIKIFISSFDKIDTNQRYEELDMNKKYKELDNTLKNIFKKI